MRKGEEGADWGRGGEWECTSQHFLYNSVFLLFTWRISHCVFLRGLVMILSLYSHFSSYLTRTVCLTRTVLISLRISYCVVFLIVFSSSHYDAHFFPSLWCLFLIGWYISHSWVLYAVSLALSLLQFLFHIMLPSIYYKVNTVYFSLHHVFLMRLYISQFAYLFLFIHVIVQFSNNTVFPDKLRTIPGLMYHYSWFNVPSMVYCTIQGLLYYPCLMYYPCFNVLSMV